jgi:hypothetical protein
MSYNLLDIQNIPPPSYKHNSYTHNSYTHNSYTHNSDSLKDIVERIFPEREFDTQIQQTTDGYSRLTIMDKLEKRCLVFTIEDDLIMVDNLYKCDSGSGTTLLHKVEQFAREFGIFKIKLEDASTITTPCEKRFSLQMLSILTTGKSWYNKLGYIQNPKKQRLMDSHNSILIQTRFADFIDMVKKTIQEDEKNEFNNLIENIKDILDFESTVQDVFIKIKDMFKNGKHCDIVIEEQLTSLIYYIKRSRILNINYDDEVKILHTGKGIQRKRNPTKKQKKTKRTKKNKTNKFLRKKLR